MDVQLVSQQAQRAVLAAMIDGREHGYGTDWRTSVFVAEHLKHALEHVKLADVMLPAAAVTEINHALCRLAMALWHILEGNK